MRAANRRSVLLSLVLAGLSVAPACAPRPSSEWPEVKRWVRQEFPGVPVMTVAELQGRLREGRPLVLLDARSAEEFEVSHLLGARSVPSQEAAFGHLAGEPRDAPVVVYCSVGYRSGALAQELIARGFTDVHNLEGSIFEWANRGLPVYRGGERVREVHPFDAEWGRLLDHGLWAEGR